MDRGTPEAQLHRAVLARGADPCLTAHPIDLLHAQGLLSEAEARAGIEYEAVRSRVQGMLPRLESAMGGLQPRQHHIHYRTDLEQLAREILCEDDFEVTRRSLGSCGRTAQVVLDRVLLDGRVDLSEAELDMLRSCLKVLGDTFAQIYARRKALASSH